MGTDSDPGRKVGSQELSVFRNTALMLQPKGQEPEATGPSPLLFSTLIGLELEC